MQRLRSGEYRSYVYTLVVASAVLVTVAAALGVWPFGDHDLMYLDADQYMAYYAWFVRCLTGESSALYSDGMILGGGMLGGYAYYASSPWNLLLVLFRENLPAGVIVITAIKTLFAAETFCILLNDRYEGYDILKAAFSTTYAFMGYCALYAWNHSWMDAVAMLPLIIVGLRRLLMDHKRMMYVVTLAVAIIANYYTGYMLCVFVVILYAVYCVEERGRIAQRIRQSIVSFALSSLIAGALSAWILIPALLAVPSDRSRGLAYIIQNYGFTFRPVELLAMFYTGALHTVEDAATNLPAVFIGVIPFALVILYYISHGDAYRRKVISGVLVFVLYASFWISPINMAWHGFSSNSWFNYRYSFVMSLVLLLVAFRAVTLEHDRKELVRAGLIWLLLLMVVLSYGSERLLAIYVTMDIVLCVLGLALLYRHDNRRMGRASVILMSALMLFNMMVNSVLTMRDGTSTTSVRAYQAAEDDAQTIKTLTTESGRVVDNDPYTRSDAVLYDYVGIVDYSSVENIDVIALCGRLGLDAYQMRTEFDANSTPASTLDLLGVRYVISETALDKYGLTLLGEVGDQKVYENSNVIPLLFKVYHPQALDDAEDDLAYRNRLWQSMTKENYGDILEAAENGVYTTKDGVNYIENTETLQRYVNAVLADPVTWSQTSDSEITTQTGDDEEMLLASTVAYEESWHVYVDGTEVETTRYADALLAVTVPAGTHEVVFRYQPEGLHVGLAISVVGLVLLVALLLWDRRRANRVVPLEA